MATLIAAVTRWRKKLDDENMSSPLWSNQELTDYFNEVCTDICHDIPILVDSTTAAICTIPLTQSTDVYSISDRIVKITRAKVSSQTKPLQIVTTDYMDANYQDWENHDEGEPQFIIDEGVGLNQIRIYPTPDAAYTLNLTVVRNQLSELVYATDSVSTIEIPDQYLSLFENGILWKAYSNQDIDAEDPKKVAETERKYMNDKERLRKIILHKTSKPYILSPMKGFV